MVGTKMFVDNGMLLQMKIIPTIWPLKSIIITRVIGGLLRTKQVPMLCQCSTDLTSNKHCLPCSNWNKKECYKRPRTLAEINNRHRVLLFLLHGGVGKVHGGLLIPIKVTMEMNQTHLKWRVSRCKSVHKMATGKSDDQIIQPDNKLELGKVTSWNWDQDWIGTKSGKLRNRHECVVTMHDADTNDNIHDCVVTLHDSYTNDNMTIYTDFRNDWAWARTV